MADEGYLLDTSIASIAVYERHRLHGEVRMRLDSMESDIIFISAISVAESEYGLNLNPLERHELQAIRKAIETYQIMPIDHHTAKVYGEIRAELFRSYAPRNNRAKVSTRYSEDLREPTSGKELGIQENDLWIVSVAVQYNLIFLTRDSAGGMQKIVEKANYVHRTEFWP